MKIKAFLVIWLLVFNKLIANPIETQKHPYPETMSRNGYKLPPFNPANCTNEPDSELRINFHEKKILIGIVGLTLLNGSLKSRCFSYLGSRISPVFNKLPSLSRPSCSFDLDSISEKAFQGIIYLPKGIVTLLSTNIEFHPNVFKTALLLLLLSGGACLKKNELSKAYNFIKKQIQIKLASQTTTSANKS